MIGDALQVVHRPLVVLQPTTFCNIDCQYCYLPDRAKMRRMSVPVIRRIASEVMASNLFDGEIAFLWHLGEPLSLPCDFYEEAFFEIAQVSEEYNRDFVHIFQTNAMLMNQDRIDLIKKHRVRLGVSLDGPAFIHDRQRITRKGAGTHAAVLKGIRLLQAQDVSFGVLAVLTDFTLDYPDEFFNFFRENGIERVGYNIDEIEGVHTSSSFTGAEAVDRYKRFLARIVELSDLSGGLVKFREVWTNLRSIVSGADPYNLANKPLRILNFDVDGNYSTYCPELVAAKSDKYGDFVMGNILKDGLDDLLANPIFQMVQAEVEEGLALCERTCSYWDYCGGGEPSSKFFQHGRFDVAETITCKIHKQATVDVLVDHLEAKLQGRKVGTMLAEDQLLQRATPAAVSAEVAPAETAYGNTGGKVLEDMEAGYLLLSELMGRLSYKPCYEFGLERVKNDVVRVSLTCLTLPSSDQPSGTNGLTIVNAINLRKIVTAADALQAFATVVARFELHEAAEFFKCDGSTVFLPHARGDSFGDFMWPDFTGLGGLYLRAVADALE